MSTVSSEVTIAPVALERIQDEISFLEGLSYAVPNGGGERMRVSLKILSKGFSLLRDKIPKENRPDMSLRTVDARDAIRSTLAKHLDGLLMREIVNTLASSIRTNALRPKQVVQTTIYQMCTAGELERFTGMGGLKYVRVNKNQECSLDRPDGKEVLRGQRNTLLEIMARDGGTHIFRSRLSDKCVFDETFRTSDGRFVGTISYQSKPSDAGHPFVYSNEWAN